MADRSDPPGPGWLSNRTGMTILAALSVFLATLILLPYLQYVLLGIVLAYILMPAQRRLERTLGSMLAALVLVTIAVLAILLPVTYVLAIALGQALEVLTAIQEGSLGMADVEAQLEDGHGIDLSDLYDTYQEPIGTALQGLATSGIELVSGLPAILIGLTVTVFVLFALLRDGDRLVAWTQTVLPIDDEIQRELLAELDQLMWASVVGNVAVAAIQAIALGLALAVLGIPAVVLLTVTTFVLALLPLIGAFGVWLPVAVYLAATNDLVGAVAIAAYGSLVSASDTYLRPALIGRTSAFNSAIVVVGIFGGIVVFGAVGLFIGPVVLGGAKVTLDAFARERTADLDSSARVEPESEAGAEEDDSNDADTVGAVEADEQPSEASGRDGVSESDTGDESTDSETRDGLDSRSGTPADTEADRSG
ncbi:AI-2E family transporter [Natronolimnohabitans sp. A-GB9]|uniref:AI-2E family transporter n=1 Tax=Natronolimnohabitans sp. A-GB9 TaxID=3069757 RepID=UPI0027B27433|nr:AI-2E family transporter [Natronolimnohabitans sp. A-GB9]MDQ2049385.1 AI-2E family transporter [Natronolimnohabitans sp. A-GB9]